jgi:phage protein D
MASTSSFVIEVEGAPLAEDIIALLTTAYVDSSLRLPDMFALRFRDTDRTVITKSGVTIGAKVKITVTTDASPVAEPLVSAEVTGLELEFDETGTFAVIRGYDPAHRLFRGRHTKSYTQTTASDAVRQVAQRVGLAAGTIESTETVFEHLAQFGQTDWEFLDGLARQAGFELMVRDNKVDFRKRKPAAKAPDGQGPEVPDPLVLRFGTDLLRVRTVVTAAEQVDKVQVRGWDVAQKRAIVAEEKAATTSVTLPTIQPAQLADVFGSPTYVATDIAYRTQAEADTAAKALAERISSSFAEVEAVARGNPKLHADVAVNVENVGQPFDGKYLITAARHRYSPTGGGYTTTLSVTGRQERSLYGLTSGYAPGTTGLGVVIALVSDVNDPSGQGRVKLTMPWLSDDYVSDWARTVQPGAAKNRGAMVVPEVGDEVLVAFEQNDPHRPYVLGGLFNGVDTPNTGGPALIDSGSGAVNRRSFISRNGHRIDLLDEDGRTEGIAMRTGDGKLRLTLDGVGTKVEIRSDGTVLVEGKKGVVIDAADAKLELTAGDISIAAKKSVKITGGSGSVDVNTSGVTASGPAVKMSAATAAEFKSGGPTVITGLPVKIN